MPQSPRPAKIALLVHTASEWSRSVLAGVARFAREHGPWEVFLEPRGFQELPRLPRAWRGDGIIARVTGAEMLRQIRNAGVPSVNVAWLGRHSRSVPQVISDREACGQCAAKHFIDRGHRHFGYVGPLQHLGYEDTLRHRFAHALRSIGASCEVFLRETPSSARSLLDQQRELSRWLAQLPKPTALLAWDSIAGREVAIQCVRAGIRVPDDVAILCVEHDDLMSNLSPVSLSSIDQSPHRVGYEAARMLRRMMDGMDGPDTPHLIPPAGVIQRRSSEHYAVTDTVVASALRLIDASCHKGINVDELWRALSVSRRTLETRFQSALGRTPAAQIRTTRMERARRLLSESDLPVAQVAVRVGFGGVEALIRNFNRCFGQSPGAYREDVRLRGSEGSDQELQ